MVKQLDRQESESAAKSLGVLGTLGAVLLQDGSPRFSSWAKPEVLAPLGFGTDWSHWQGSNQRTKNVFIEQQGHSMVALYRWVALDADSFYLIGRQVVVRDELLARSEEGAFQRGHSTNKSFAWIYCSEDRTISNATVYMSLYVKGHVTSCLVYFVGLGAGGSLPITTPCL